MPLLYIYYVAALLSGIGWLDEIDDESATGIKIAFAVLTVLVGLSGFASVFVRWLALRCGGDASQSSSPDSKEYSVLQGRVTTIQMESTPVASEPSADNERLSSL